MRRFSPCALILYLCVAAALIAQPAPYSINTVLPPPGMFGSPDTLGSIYAVAASATRDVYIADKWARVFRRAPDGAISVVAGNGVRGFGGDNGPATLASLDQPSALALDGTGNLYIVDTGNRRIRRLNLATGVIATVVGGLGSGFGDGWPGDAIGLPVGIESVTVTSAGTLLFPMNGFVAELRNDGKVYTAFTIPGGYSPFGVASDPTGAIFATTGAGLYKRAADTTVTEPVIGFFIEAISDLGPGDGECKRGNRVVMDVNR